MMSGLLEDYWKSDKGLIKRVGKDHLHARQRMYGD